MAGIHDLSQLLAKMEPELQEGEYVFLTFPTSSKPSLPADTVATIQEPEGLTAVVPRYWADTNGYSFDFVAAWILLRVHSDLAAIGLTAAVSTALAEGGISCNVIAGYYHDHLFVPKEKAPEALANLRKLIAN